MYWFKNSLLKAIYLVKNMPLHESVSKLWVVQCGDLKKNMYVSSKAFKITKWHN